MFVDALFLRENLRGVSIGKVLMEKVKEEAKRLGYASVRLMTPSDNTGAIRFYKRLGGEPASKLWFWFQI
jgi:ribosomal protein S18 acetylase RimI-like enzyme